jgi:hypothetical protein
MSRAPRNSPITEHQWEHIFGILDGACYGSNAVEAAWKWLRSNGSVMQLSTFYERLRKERRARNERAAAGAAEAAAAATTSTSTACGRCCRGDSAAGPPCSDADLVPHEEPRAFDPKKPDLAGASWRLPAARQVSAGTSRCLASGYTSVCALRSQLEPSRTRPPLWLRAFVSTEVSRCNALPRV